MRPLRACRAVCVRVRAAPRRWAARVPDAVEALAAALEAADPAVPPPWELQNASVRALVDAHQDDAAALVRLGAALVAVYGGEARALGAAGAALGRAVQLRPESVDAHYWSGRLYHELGRGEDAHYHYMLALQHEPKHFKTHLALGNLAATTGHYRIAIEAFMRALEIDATSALAMQNMGTAYVLHGNSVKGLEWLQRATEAADAADRVEFLLYAALMAEQTGAPGTALQHADAALALAPEHPGAHLRRGAALLELRRLPEAEAALQTALGYNSSDDEALNKMGLVAMMLYDDHTVALGWFQQAAAAAPARAQAHDNMGMLMCTADSLFPSARAHFERALALEPDFLTARINLAAWHKNNGTYDEGLAVIAAAPAMGPAEAGALQELHTEILRLRHAHLATEDERRAAAEYDTHFEEK